jgi:hypothetical protein
MMAMTKLLSLSLLILCASCGRFGFSEVEVSADASDESIDAGADSPLGHDEDGDGIADIDDLCPFINSKNQLDQDGDGVGDVCDSFPNVANTMTFYPLLAGGANPASGVSGNWQNRNDEWLMTDLVGGNFHVNGPTNNTEVFVGFVVESVLYNAGSDNNHELAVRAESSNNLTYHYGHYFSQGVGKAGVSNNFKDANVAVVGLLNPAQTGAPFQTGRTDLSVRFLGGSKQMVTKLVNSLNPAGVTSTSANPALTDQDHFHIDANGVSVRLLYVAIVRPKL